MTSRRSVLAMLAALAAVTLAAFWPVLGNGFLNYDDDTYITDNPLVRAGLTWRGAAGAFTSLEQANWHPLTWLSHMLDVQLFGLRPAGHHLVSLLWHLASAILLLVLLWRMTGAFLRSWAVAALFAVHPLHVQSVAWAAERKDVLSAFFWLAALLAWGRHAARPGRRPYASALLLYTLALMAKPMPVTLPFLLLLLDFWPLGRMRPGRGGPGWSLRALLLEKVPFLALASASAWVTWLAQEKSGATTALAAPGLAGRAANASLAYAAYLLKTAWPEGLSIFYPYPKTVAWWPAAAALLLLGALTAWCLLSARRRPWMAVGWLWYLGTLLPVIGLVQVGRQAMADRYTYFPLVGIFVLAAWGAAELGGRFRVPRPALAAAAPVLVLALAALTRVQSGYWRDSLTVFTRAARVTPRNTTAIFNLGRALKDEGRAPEAAARYREVLALDPGHAEAHNNLANLLFESGLTEEAIPHYRAAIQADPDSPFLYHNLAVALSRRGDLEDAALLYRQALARKPDSPLTLANLAPILEAQGRREEAVACLERALALDPGMAMAHYNLGVILHRRGGRAEAARHFREALRLDPSLRQAREALAAIPGQP